MKRYIKSSKSETIEYQGYSIEHNAYGKGEYTIGIDGDDVWCDSLEEAKETIDSLNR